jgi:hypothetical protein
LRCSLEPAAVATVSVRLPPGPCLQHHTFLQVNTEYSMLQQESTTSSAAHLV